MTKRLTDQINEVAKFDPAKDVMECGVEFLDARRLLPLIEHLARVAEAAEGWRAHLDTCSEMLSAEFDCSCGFEQRCKALNQLKAYLESQRGG